MSPPTVVIRGTFADTSLPELLVTLLDRSSVGTLVLQEADGSKSAILIVRGAPAKAKLAHNPVFLGEVLVDLGVIDEATRRATLEEALESRRPHGQVLLAHGNVDDTALYVALREQLHRQMLALCELPSDTAFGLYPVNYLDSWGPTSEWRVKPLPLVWRALADKAPITRVEQIVAHLGERELRMRFEAPVGRYRLEKNELALVNILRAKPQPVSLLLGSGVGSEERVRRTVYALAVTRQLELGANMEDPVGAHEPPESPQSIPPPAMRPKSRGPAPPGQLSSGQAPSGPPSVPTRAQAPQARRSAEETQAIRKEVEERRAQDAGNYYELIGVPRGADTPTIRGAFFQLAKRWHPDRLGDELADLREFVTKTFAHMSEAHQVLTDDDQRKRYDELLDSGGMEEQEQVLAVIRAAGAFQKAEVLIKKRDFAAALEEAQAAYDGDPEQAEYGALYAHLMTRDPSADVMEALGILDKAVESEPDNVRIRWYRGELLKKLGNEPRAMRDFKHIVNLKPHHVDALRELRLYEMRKGGSSDPSMRRVSSSSNPKADPNASKKSGMFGKWLKK